MKIKEQFCQRLVRGDGCFHVEFSHLMAQWDLSFFLFFFFIKLSKVISSLQNLFHFSPPLSGRSQPSSFSV